jgi:cbb3-type cytochrome oxidase subunit 3
MKTAYSIFFYVMVLAFIGSCIFLYIESRNYSENNKNEDK